MTAPVAQNASYANLESTVTATTGSGGQSMVGSTATILAGTASVPTDGQHGLADSGHQSANGVQEGFVSDVLDLTALESWMDRPRTAASIPIRFVLQMGYNPLAVEGRTGLSELAAAQAGLIQMDYLDLGPDGIAGTADDQWEIGRAWQFRQQQRLFRRSRTVERRHDLGRLGREYRATIRSGRSWITTASSP